MNAELLTAREVADVDAYINSRENRRWERETLARWDREAGRPSPEERYRALLKANHVALIAKAHAAKLQRTPAWADLKAIHAFYVKARQLTASTGIPHHVDHIVPLQGRLVSGLHVENNLQVLTRSENARKNNRFEVEE